MTTAAADYTFSYEVPQSPREVYDAVVDVRGWWSQRITGDTDRLGEFVYEVPGIHRTRARITDLAPGRRVVWRVIENWFASDPDVDEWAGTDIVFDIAPTEGGSRLTFTHLGLTPELDCFDRCSVGWSRHALESLRKLITTGTGAPITPADETALQSA
ncbi:SRPBCC domain-containing protein [Microbacterium sp. ARD32]|uniref:SRPBCC family protein n=1 Tax=Microbacterium sp. ARD32 TaxID=2962577 RepID=UPI0028824B38|nr:SRPBCC domain-containing protein [Microbacterium sp. ARD32]MDT0156208.1 SRPBCC domain-containing protein [Microbacterium sp. ARD32]